jgi:transposase
MHLVTKTIKGCEYFYLVEKKRQGDRVVTAHTVYIGDRRKLAELVQQSAVTHLPVSFEPQPVAALLALAEVAKDLGIEDIIDSVCPTRRGAAPVGRRLVIAAIARCIAERSENGLRHLRPRYEQSVLAELFPVVAASLDGRRMHEMLIELTDQQIDGIQAAVIGRLLEAEGVSTESLAFDCTNFDSYAAATTPSRLLRRGHSKSGRPLRVLGLGLLASADDGMPLLSFVYPGNENDITAFGRFLRALNRRRETLHLSLDTTVAADGGNISKQMLQRLEKRRHHYVIRLPAAHVTDLDRPKSDQLEMLDGALAGKVRAQKFKCAVYGEQRTVVDVYSRRMHKRQLPGLHRDRARARADLAHLQHLLERQRQGLRRSKPITVRSLRTRVDKVLSREHMKALFRTTVTKEPCAPQLTFEESERAWDHLQDYVLGRTLLVSDRDDWTAQQIVMASRVQSHNEHVFRDIKDPGGVSMLPLRHRADRALRAHALVVVLGLILAKVLQRRVKTAGGAAPSLASVLKPLKQVQRARVEFPADAPPALRALAATTWIPSERTERQRELLAALNLTNRHELGTTLAEKLTRKKAGRRPKNAP